MALAAGAAGLDPIKSIDARRPRIDTSANLAQALSTVMLDSEFGSFSAAVLIVSGSVAQGSWQQAAPCTPKAPGADIVARRGPIPRRSQRHRLGRHILTIPWVHVYMHH